MNNICMRHALRTGIAGSIGCSIYLFIYQSHCIWIVISALLLCQTHTTGSFINLFTHAIDRIIATGIGVSLGLLGYTLIFLNVNDSNKEIIPIDIINKEPSAELSPGQKDQDSLPSYIILDEILYLYIELSLSKKEIIAKGFNSKVVDSIIKKVDQNEYKRNQAAPGIKITSLAFGIGRRMPIVQKYLN